MKIFQRAGAVLCLVLAALEARATLGTSFQAQLGNPSGATTDPANRANLLLARPQYVLAYNDTTREASWVSWDFTPADRGPADRSDAFAADPLLPPGFVAIDENGYRNSGFDRGHMCPSADRTVTLADNQATFYMTNIVPQTPDNNQGPWARFEDECRRLADLGNEMLLVSGPGGFGGTVLASGVAVPAFTWKIAVVVPDGPGPAASRITAATRVIALKIPNTAGIRSTPWQNFITSAAQIERDTGLAFFTALPTSVAAALRVKVDGQPDAVIAPVITRQPGAVVALVGGTATFSVAATGTPTPSYQWQRDGVAIAGATSATLTLPGLTTAQAGEYSVVVSSAAGSVTSSRATLTVIRRSYAGFYFGTLRNTDGATGAFALAIRADHTGDFLGYDPIPPFLSDLIAGGHYGGLNVYIGRAVSVDDTGRFRVIASTTTRITPADSRGAPGVPVTTNRTDLILDGNIADDGTITGRSAGTGLTLAGTKSPATGAAAALAGFYATGATNSSSRLLALVSATGQTLVVADSAGVIDGAVTSLDANAAFTVTTAQQRIAGTFAAAPARLAAETVSASGAPVAFSGLATSSTASVAQRLVNLSTRTSVDATNPAIVGFVLTGLESKTVLVRAVGPGLRSFGVTPTAANPVLVLRRTDSPAPINASATAAEFADAAVRVGAFPLSPGDAGGIATLPAGAYTAAAQVAAGGAGACLIEIYDLTPDVVGRMVNLSARAAIAPGGDALITGVVVTGSAPKRVLLRAAGPALAQFGVAGALARPQLTLFAGATIVATNAGWSTSADAAALADAASRTGAFAFPAGSADAALVVNLAPGAYTAQVTGAAGASGIALIESYEVP